MSLRNDNVRILGHLIFSDMGANIRKLILAPVFWENILFCGAPLHCAAAGIMI